jgi:acyl-CoA reductase-like NAD-dependent aldehyde dehydrogenase
VVKAPRTSPLSVMFVYRELLAPVLERHGAPSGTINVISGRTKPVLRRWLESPHSNTLLFCGDSSAGIKLGREWHAQDKKAVLELAGNDGLVVWKDADLDGAAAALMECFFGSSQICMVPKYGVVHPAIVDEFLERFLRRVAAIRPAKPEEESALLSPVLKTDRYFDFLSEAREAGCPILAGGRRIDVEGAPAIDGLFIEPTVVRVDGLDRARELACVREETFFPLLPIVVPADGPDDTMLDAVTAFINANEYGLRNSVFASDAGVLERFAAGISNGGLLKINDSHIGFAPYLATHGGNGKTGGPYGELNYVGIRTSRLQGISWGTGKIEPFDELAGERTTASA